ncbi:trans-aconitate 2-methyltransferase [Candidimonas humi]|uniref:Trans-aconitate 2-methyltransferase n=1 Tax=Candidimonas humi TaxID=683355 RepID=A0ABV8P0J7_9BURK|nr:trans-aconitate 2-methyltransferase [Candidimonas humi]MBV6306352.1 trans-aconitate 2-methyltransferase [Candidimonas humi]
MKDWNPELYTRFEAERTRPAQELLDRIFLDRPARVVDLGCGPGNSTELLANRYPGARVTGIDTSEAMLESARKRLPGCTFDLGDIATWQPEIAPDLLYANASLQWVPDHASLFPRLMSCVAPGGVFAVQMPSNRDEPSHSSMREVAANGPWASAIGNAAAVRIKVQPLTDYYDMIAPLASEIDVWCCIYHHQMPSADAIVEWVRATGLKPFVERLPADQQAAFIDAYRQRIDAAYPPRTDGLRLLKFPRIFMVARRKQ